MTKVEEFNKMQSKALKGKKGFQLVSCGQDGLNYQYQDQQSAITSLALGIWDDTKVHICRTWNGTAPVDTSNRFIAVVQDEEKFMVAVENVGLFSFGTESDSDDKCKAVLFVQCGCITTFITAVNDPPMLLVHGYVQDDDDPLSLILPDLFNHLLANHQEEVDANA